MISGRCLCSGVRFEITGEIGTVVQCHCSMCRRANGTAFATNAPVHADVFRIVQGQELITEYESSPGRLRAFCSRCGSPVYSRMPDRPEIRRVRLGTLDEDPGARPVAHIWISAKAPWDTLPEDGLERFDEAPPQPYYASPRPAR
ncbi:GFA family protein [Sorangium sp. So ce131]|uniref:GFA family protein n=1 Tax=Sorangium sp. So ce131 TaxID=3133282 RepID=UPI003F643597